MRSRAFCATWAEAVPKQAGGAMLNSSDAKCRSSDCIVLRPRIEVPAPGGAGTSKFDDDYFPALPLTTPTPVQKSQPVPAE